MKKLFKYLLRTVLILFILINIITAFHAYKFTHFYENGEITVKKNEDKTGWDKTKEALFGIKAVKQKNTVIPDSGSHTVYLTTKNKLKLEAWYIPADSAKGTICMFHGHGGNKSGVYKEAQEFKKLGYNTLLVDFRAHGNSEGNTCTIGYDESEDIKLAYDFVKAKGENNIILWGISMGGAAVTKAMNDYPLQPKKVILEMPFGSIKTAVEGRIKMMKIPPQPLATFIIFWGGVQNGFWAFKMKPFEYAKKINCPTLIQTGKNDPRVSLSEIESILKNIAAEKKLVVYENSGHESLCKKETEKWVKEVAEFLR